VPRDIAIDLGTSSLQIFERNSGLVFNEPSVLALDDSTGKVIDLGFAALPFIGHSAGSVRLQRPIRHGTITDFAMAVKLVSAAFKRIGVSRLSRARILVLSSAVASSVERRAMMDVAREAGASRAEVIEQSLAGAIGLDLPIQDPTGSVVVSLGAGTTEAAMISLGGVVSREAIRIGGEDINTAIALALRSGAGLVVGDRSAEEIKRSLPQLLEDPTRTLEVIGREGIHGEPASVVISGAQIEVAIAEIRRSIVQVVTKALALAPPELAQDAIDGGIHLFGGAAQLHGIGEMIATATEVSVVEYPEPELTSITGAGNCLASLSSLKAIFEHP